MKLLKLHALLLLAAVLVLSGCPSPTDTENNVDDNGNNNGGNNTTITVPVTALEVDTLAELEVGETVTLTAVITPTNANTGITWSSSNTDVATVDQDGVVTAVAQGNADVTIASTVDPSIKATTEVAVYSAREIIEGFALYTQPNAEGGVVDAVGTTTEVPSLVNDVINIENHALAYFKNAGQFDSNTILYYDTALTGEFRIKARFIRENIINETIASGSSNRGVLIGAMSKDGLGTFTAGDPEGTPAIAETKYAMMFSRTRGDVRSYYHKDDAVGAGSPNLEYATALNEYIFEVKRTAVGITFSVFNSKSGELIESNEVPFTAETAGDGLDAGLHLGQELYPAFVVGGAKATFSNIEIYSGPEESEVLLYETEPVEGSAVSVSSVEVSGPELNSYTETVDNETITISYANSFTEGMDPIQLTANVFPSVADDTTVTWSSSDTAVATVDENGLVSFVGSGSATITVTTNDQGFIDEYHLSLTSGSVLVTGITISGVANDELMQGLTGYISASVEPADASDQTVAWSSDNEAVATIDADTGAISAVSTGSVTFTATANDGSGITQTYTLTVVELENTLFTWVAPTLFDASSGPVTVDGKTVTGRDSHPAITTDGINLANGRFNIGTHYNDNGSAGATEWDTAADVMVDDGEFNFLNKVTTVTITYSSSNESSNFRCYINNNSTSESKSVIYIADDPDTEENEKVKSYVSVDTDLVAGGGTTTFTIDSSVYNNHESLANAFIQLRADSSTEIMITSIVIAYQE